MALYVGYFGAGVGVGVGVMVLTLLLLTVNSHVAQANALKNMLLWLADVCAASGFAVFGPVPWSAAAPLALGVLAAARSGRRLTRRVPGNLLRVLVALTGLGLAIRPWVAPL